jgi:urea transport system permease protein
MIAQVLDIATTAAILYVVSAGLLLVFGVMKIINFAHGALLTIGSYAAVVAGWLGLTPWLALPCAAIVGALTGIIIERVVVRPLYTRPLDAILATWGLGIVIGQLLTIAFGRGVHFADSPLKGIVSVLGVDYSLYRLALVGVAVALGLCISALLSGTRLGLETRAVIMNEDLARGIGINSGLVRFITFAVGSALAAAAGMLITPLSSVDPNMGVPWLVNAFMLVLVSGSSLLSLAIACLVLGGAQVLVSSYLSPVLGGLTIAVLAAVILRVRPRGFADA